MDVFYHVITFIGGLIGGVVLTIYKYRNYILPVTGEIVRALDDGKITFHEVLGALIVAYSQYTGEDERKTVLETIRYLKQRWNLD
jgi:hypothetical protein